MVSKGAFNVTPYPLKNSSILDTGATIHIFNDRKRFTEFRPTVLVDEVYAGKQFIQISGYGKVAVWSTKAGTKAGVQRHLSLQDAALIRDMACNLVSLRQLRKGGYWWDNKGSQTYLMNSEDEVVCELVDRLYQFVMEDIPASMPPAALTSYRQKINSGTARSASIGDGNLWHLRLGHPGQEVIAQLTKHTEGVRIKGPTTVKCSACVVAKAKQLIRRVPREGASRSGERWAFDFVPFIGDPEGYNCMMLAVDQYSGLARDYFLNDNTTDTYLSAFEYFLGELDNQDEVAPKTFELDNELLKHTQVTRMQNHRTIFVLNLLHLTLRHRMDGGGGGVERVVS